MVEFSSRESIASLKESINIPAVEHEAAVPFKSRLLSLKWPGSQSSNHPMPKFKEQSPPSINEITQLLSERDTVSPIWVICKQRHMMWLMEKDKNVFLFMFAGWSYKYVSSLHLSSTDG